MLLRLISNFINNILYIKIGENQFTLINPKDGSQKVFKSPEPFNNQRLGVAEFRIANNFLSNSLKEFYGKTFLPAAPKVIIHQLVKTEGGLCEVEKRMLQELAISAGARDVYVWEGAELTNDQLINETYL